MRIACPACEVTQEVAGLIPVEGGFGFACTACGARPVLAPLAASPAPPAAGEPVAPPAEPGIPAVAPAPQPAAKDLILLSDPEAPAKTTGAAAPVASLVERQGPRPPPGQVACPKCGHWQADPSFCHRCGLDLIRASRGELDLRPEPLEGHRLTEQANKAWARIAGHLEDVEAHRAFIALCAEHGLLEFAGQCYRRAELALRQGGTGEAMESHPADQAQAAQRLSEYRQRVIQAAMARIGTGDLRARGIDPAKVRRWLLLTALALLFLGFAVGMYIFSRYQNFWMQNG